MSGDEGEEGRNPVYVAIILTICGVAVVLNVVVIYVLAKWGRFRTSVDIFLANLAVTDITLAGIVYPVHFGTVADPGEDFGGGSAGCKIAMFIPLVAIMSAITTIVAIAIDRYRVIILRQSLSRAGAFIVIGITWLVSIIVSAPQLYEYRIYTETDDEYNARYNATYRSCGSEGVPKQFKTIYASIVFVVAYGIPLITLVICYISIARFLRKHAKSLRNTSIKSNPGMKTSMRQPVGVNTRNIRVVKMLLSIGVTFVALWTPFFIMFAMTEITNEDHMEDQASWPHLVSRTMTVLSTVSNPTIFLAFSTPFRRAVHTAVSACRDGQCNCGWTDEPSSTGSDLNSVAMEIVVTACSDAESPENRRRF